MNNSSLPFTDTTMWEYLRWHSYLSRQHRLLYVATPKVACTSLQWWFAELVGCSAALKEFGDSTESDPDLVIHDGFRVIAPTVTGLMPEALEEAVLSERYFRFAVVRNPFTRLFSAWQSKILLREPLQVGPYLEHGFFNMPVENAADIARAFEAFLEHLAASEAPNFLDIHWTPQASLLRPDLIPYSKLSQIEDTAGLSKALAQHLSRNTPDPFASHRTNQSLIPYLPSLITDRSAALIRLLYAQDFASFGYATGLPPSSTHFSDAQLGSALQAIGLIRGRHKRLSEVRALLSERIDNLNNALSQDEAELARLAQEIHDRNAQISTLRESALDREHTITTLNETILARESRIASLHDKVAERESNIAGLNQVVSAQQEQIAALGRALQNTFSYKVRGWLAVFLRRTMALAARLLPVRNETAYAALRSFYRRLPLSLDRKMPWAQHLLADVPELQSIAYRLEQKRPLMPFAASAAVHAESSSLPVSPSRRILVVEHRLPTPDRNSSSVRLLAMLKIMAELDWQVTFVSNSRPPEYEWLLGDPGRELPRYEAALSALGIHFMYGMEDLIEHLKVEGPRYRFALLSYPEIMHQVAPLVRAYMPNASLLYDTVDLHGLRFAREAAARDGDALLLEKSNRYWQMELAAAECADRVIAVTQAEREELLRRVPSASVEIVPNIHSLYDQAPGIEGREGLLFIGHFAHSPNADAVAYFVREVLPLIHERLPGLPFNVLGSSMTDDLRHFESAAVHMIGFVEDPVPWFEHARVFVAPLRFGAGMKGKVGQSLSLGLPVVTTSVGAEGMLLEHGRNVLVADTPRAFADAVIRLYTDNGLWNEFAAQGRAHVARHFSEATARAALARLLMPEAPTLPAAGTE